MCGSPSCGDCTKVPTKYTIATRLDRTYWRFPRSVFPASLLISCERLGPSEAGGLSAPPVVVCDATMPFARMAAPMGPPKSSAYWPSSPEPEILSNGCGWPTHFAITIPSNVLARRYVQTTAAVFDTENRLSCPTRRCRKPLAVSGLPRRTARRQLTNQARADGRTNTARPMTRPQREASAISCLSGGVVVGAVVVATEAAGDARRAAAAATATIRMRLPRDVI